MVFDVAAEYKSSNLKKALLTGPDLLHGLVGGILGFCNYIVAL